MKRLWTLLLVPVMVLGVTACDYNVSKEAVDGCWVQASASTTNSGNLHYASNWYGCDNLNHAPYRLCVWVEREAGPRVTGVHCDEGAKASGSAGSWSFKCNSVTFYKLVAQFQWQPFWDQYSNTVAVIRNIDCQPGVQAA